MNFEKKKIYFVLHKIYDPIKFNENLYYEDISSEFLDFILKEIIFLNHENSEEPEITFDDGNISDYTIVLPKLLDNSLKATFFVVTDLIGSKNYVTWEMLEEMSNLGMNIGSHTCSHKNLLLLKEKDLNMEIGISKSIIEQKIGKEVINFSCPYGIYNKRIEICAKKYSYKNFFTSNNGLSRADSFKKNRNSINSLTTKKSFKKILYPSTSRQFRWIIEEYLKNSIKTVVGIENYLIIRKLYAKLMSNYRI